jgi:hypothetical protein
MKKIMIAIAMVVCAASFCLAGEQKPAAMPAPAPQAPNAATMHQAAPAKAPKAPTAVKKPGKEVKSKNKRAKAEKK